MQFFYEEQNIDDTGSEEWMAKYKFDIPVVHINGKYLMKHRINECLLRKALDNFKDKEETQLTLICIRPGKVFNECIDNNNYQLSGHLTKPQKLVMDRSGLTLGYQFKTQLHPHVIETPMLDLLSDSIMTLHNKIMCAMQYAIIQ